MELTADSTGAVDSAQPTHAAASPPPVFEPARRSGTVEIPHSLRGTPANHDVFDWVILGAGCAGLTSCLLLLEQGVTTPILLIDRRTTFRDDRTWCFWDIEPTPFTHLAVARWSDWAVRTGTGTDLLTVTTSNERFPYLCLTAADFYSYALERIAGYPNVTLLLGHDVFETQDYPETTTITTSAGNYRARTVLDGRGLPPGDETFEMARTTANWVPQQFVGLRVRTSRPVFDPTRCMLMDFSVSQDSGIRFMYVLPFSETEALIENVYLAEPHLSQTIYRDQTLEYLAGEFGLAPHEYVIDGEERGYIPMTDFTFPMTHGSRTHRIGMLGGGTRASTGYTFLRIQRSCRELITALVSGEPAPTRIDRLRFTLLDRVFLRFMIDSPHRAPDVFSRMFRGTPSNSLVRFLSEKSSALDELRIILALPKRLFLGAAARAFLQFARSSSRRPTSLG